MSALAAPRPAAGSHLAEVLRSEWCKLRSVRSTYWMLGAALLCNVGLAALLAIFLPDQLSAKDKATLDTTRVSLGGIHLSQVAFGVLGVVVVTSEYGSGMIRMTLAAVPQRRLLLAAKLVVLASVAFGVGLVSSFAAYFVFQACLSDASLRSSLGDPGVLRGLIGGGLYLTMLGALGLGLGAIARASAGAIAAIFSLLFVPPLLLELLPHSWNSTLRPYVPMEAGAQMFSTVQGPQALGPWSGFAVFALYAVLALVAGFIAIERRDA